MKSDFKFKFPKRKKPASLLGLAIDGSKLDGVVLRRVNGSLQAQQSFSATLTLDPLTAAPELVGREIRNHLDAAGVREKNCVVGVPLKWILTAHTELPPLPEADAASLLQMEAERGFPSDVSTLQISESRTPLAADKKYVLFTGVPNTQLNSLQQVLAAAKLKPVSFTPGISALQSPASEKSNGVLALVIGEHDLDLQVTVSNGIAALRVIEGAVENEAGRRSLNAPVVLREARITLGQLPEELRAAVKRIHIFGPRELAQPLADELELKFEPLGLTVETISNYAPDEFGAQLPSGKIAVSAAFSLAARALTETNPPFEFLPPKPSFVEQFVNKYTSGRLGTVGAAAAAIVILVALLFLYQQIQLWRLRSQWSQMQARVAQIQDIQNQIVRYRPWYDGTYPTLSILQQLSLAFPQDGSVTAKTIEIRDGNTVTCSGTARDSAALLAMQAKLRAATGVNAVQINQLRGKTPLQFTFGFQYGNGVPHAN